MTKVVIKGGVGVIPLAAAILVMEMNQDDFAIINFTISLRVQKSSNSTSAAATI